MRAAFRPTVELIVAIAMAVAISRTWMIEGYVIPTASMAESLWGTHRRVVCHDCGWTFAVGYDARQRSATRAVCPNCGYTGNRLEGLSPTPGDRLLVWKTAYALRRPRRWEPVVFHSPEQPTTVYVKRVVGLPGELVEIRGGDVYIDGQLARKPLAVQRAMALVVNDSRFRSPGLMPRWRSDAPQSGWRSTVEGHFVYRPDRADETATLGAARPANDAPRPPLDPVGLGHWLVYHHHRRLPKTRADRLEAPLAQATRTPRAHPTRARDARPEERAGTHRRGAAAPVDGGPAAATSAADCVVPCPVEDTYGYNQSLPRRVEETHPVGDLLLRCRLRTKGNGRLWLWATNGRDRLAVCIEPQRGAAHWFHNQRAVRTGAIERWPEGTWLDVEMSIVDHQLIVAIDGRELGTAYAFQPATATAVSATHANAITSGVRRNDWEAETSDGRNRGSGTSGAERMAGPDDAQAVRRLLCRPVAIGAEGLEVEIAWLTVLRDVYYTAGPLPIAGSRPTTVARLNRHEFFVLGDNSPVSYDSRAWKRGPGLDERLLLGRPLVVHLPVRNVRWGSRGRTFRIPDVRRIRYIR